MKLKSSEKSNKKISYSDIEIPEYIKDKKKWKKYAKESFFTFKAYEEVNKEKFKQFKTFSKILTNKNHIEYYRFVLDFYFKIDSNIIELNKGLKLLLNKKNPMPSIFLLRGLTELIFFNIYIAFKSYLFIKKNNIKGLADLICKASLGSGVQTIKSNIISSESFILKKIISKYDKKRIHINDCIRFFKKDPFSKIYRTKENKKIKSYSTLEDLKKPLDWKLLDSEFSQAEKKKMKYLIDESPDLILDAYDKMCEIIHPTGILIYDAQDLNTHYDYREIYNSIGGSKFFYINLLAIFYKMFTLLWYLENSEKFIAEFNMNLTK